MLFSGSLHDAEWELDGMNRTFGGTKGLSSPPNFRVSGSHNSLHTETVKKIAVCFILAYDFLFPNVEVDGFMNGLPNLFQFAGAVSDPVYRFTNFIDNGLYEIRDEVQIYFPFNYVTVAGNKCFRIHLRHFPKCLCELRRIASAEIGYGMIKQIARYQNFFFWQIN